MDFFLKTKNLGFLNVRNIEDNLFTDLVSNPILGPFSTCRLLIGHQGSA